MERYAWKAKLKPGKLEEYKKRHDEIWMELVEVLKQSGISNYSIFNTGDELFGYYECDKGIAFAGKIQAESEVVARWNLFMDEVMTMEVDSETGAQPRLLQVFYME